MSVTAYVNGNDILTRYNARILDYVVGATKFSNVYLSQNNSVIPVKVKESIGTRKIEVELEFSGESCHEALLSISNMTAELLDETELELPDGFFYYCILDKVGTPKYKGGTYYSVKFTLVGYRHGAMQSKVFTETGAIDVLGNWKAPAIITIEDAVGTVTVNDITVKDIKAKVVINGFDKTVFEIDGIVATNKYKSCEMTSFPCLNPSVNMINITGEAKVTIEYKPIYL